MKLILSTFVAATLATALSAGQSDRYHDQRLDTATTEQAEPQTDAAFEVVRISTRDSDKAQTPYAYLNPYGVGPDNDSR